MGIVKSGGLKLDELDGCRRLRNGIAALAHVIDVQLYGLLDEALHALASFCHRDAPRQIRHISPIAFWSFFDDNQVFHVSPHLRPACRRMLLSVPGGTSSDNLPATVPGLRG